MEGHHAGTWSGYDPYPPPWPNGHNNLNHFDGAYVSAQQGATYPAYAPTPPNYYPPLPPGPPSGPSSLQMYQFGQQANPAPPTGPAQFNFQPTNQLPTYPTRDISPDRYRNSGDRYDGRRNRRDQDRGGHNRRNNQRFERRPRMAADRPLLNARRDSTPDQLDGMADTNASEPKFRDLENMSDSDSEVMDESESENETRVKGKVQAPEEARSLPKWSNPEPYTSLPPPDASRKRKDMVKLIRKAKIAQEKHEDHMKQLAQNDDFISFGFEEEEGPHKFATNEMNSAPSHHGHQSGEKITNGHVDGEAGKAPHLPVTNSIAPRLQILKRKRSSNDLEGKDISLLMSKRLKLGKKGVPTGEVLEEWSAKDPVACTPWTGKHQWTENAGFRLHKEICDFYEFVKPHDFEETMRLDLLGRIRRSIKSKHPSCEIHAFGSFAAGLYLPDADLDLVVISQEFIDTGRSSMSSNNMLHRLSAWLVEQGVAHKDSTEVITHAKVPLIKFKDRITSLRVDISFENLTGPIAVKTFRKWKSSYPAMPIIVMVIKQFLMMRGLNEVVNGGLGGFSVTCLVMALLQNMPRVQTRELIPEQHLGEVLLEFLDLYGNQFDLYATAIDLDPPQFIDKVHVSKQQLEMRTERLHIVDPNDRSNDISGGSRNVAFIFKQFSHARTEIITAMRRNDPVSLLGWMLGGDYSIYLVQRECLKRLHQDGTWPRMTMDDELSNSENLLTRRDAFLPIKTQKPVKPKYPRQRPNRGRVYAT